MPIVNREMERKIVEEGRRQGKTDEFIKQAVLRYRERELAKGAQPEAATSSVQKPLEPPKKKFLQRVDDTLTRVGEKQGKKFLGAVERQEQGKQSLGETALQATGSVIGGAADLLFSGAVGAGKALVPDAVGAKAAEVNKAFLESPLGQAGLETLKQGMDVFGSWKAKNPRAAANLEAAVDIAQFVPAGALTKAGLKGIQATGQGTKFLAKKTGETAIKVGEKTLEGAKKAGENAYETAKPFLQKVGDKTFGEPVEKGVQTALRRGKEIEDVNVRELVRGATRQKLDRYITQAEKAIEDYSQKTPLELAGEEAERALEDIGKQMKLIGEEKQKLTKTFATSDVGKLVTTTRKDLRKKLAEKIGMRFGLNGDIRSVKGRTVSVSDDADLRMLKAVDDKLKSIEKNPSFQKIDDAIDYVQDLLFKRSSVTAVPVNKRIEGILKSSIRELNDKLKEIGGDAYIKVNSDYQKRVQTFEKLNKALGTEGTKGAALMKQLFSPSGTLSRDIFASVKELTDSDLVQEATIAKFVMENIGDVRQANLLEQVLKGQGIKKGLIDKAMKKVFEKVQDPINRAKEIADE